MVPEGSDYCAGDAIYLNAFRKRTCYFGKNVLVKMHKITRYFLVVIYDQKWLTLTENGDILDLKMNEKENKWLKMIRY